jgi:hypothetical protein
MELASARDLKSRLLDEIVLPFTQTAGARSRRARADAGEAGRFDAVAAASALAVSAAPVNTLRQIHRSLALGITRSGRQYRIAVRVQRSALMASPLVERIVAQANGEADVRLVGRIGTRLPAGATSVAWNRGRIRPLAIGSSVAHVNVTMGTIGAFVERNGRIYILSNNHILADENRGSRGDAVLQPGALDSGEDPADRVATLSWYVPLTPAGVNFVDAALAEVDPALDVDSRLLRGIAGGADCHLAGLGPDFLDEGTAVHKLGRTTGATEGRVTAFELDNLVVAYGIGNLRFDRQIEIDGTGNAAFADSGDSGALIVNAGMQAVALLFAGGGSGGSSGLGLTYANPIRRVLEETRAALLL